MPPLPHWLKPLEFLHPTLPCAAVEAAIARDHESTPYLLHALAWADEHADEVLESEPAYILHLYALFLLAHFRDKRAYPLVVKLFRNPQQDRLTGYFAIDYLH